MSILEAIGKLNIKNLFSKIKINMFNNYNYNTNNYNYNVEKGGTLIVVIDKEAAEKLNATIAQAAQDNQVSCVSKQEGKADEQADGQSGGGASQGTCSEEESGEVGGCQGDFSASSAC